MVVFLCGVVRWYIVGYIVICFDYYLVIGFSESVGYDEVDQFVLLIVVQIDMVLVLELLV